MNPVTSFLVFVCILAGKEMPDKEVTFSPRAAA